jgi:hypothetical protein
MSTTSTTSTSSTRAAGLHALWWTGVFQKPLSAAVLIKTLDARLKR